MFGVPSVPVTGRKVVQEIRGKQSHEGFILYLNYYGYIHIVLWQFYVFAFTDKTQNSYAQKIFTIDERWKQKVDQPTSRFSSSY